MRCAKCGKLIRNPESVRAGYGPVCYEKLFGKQPEIRGPNCRTGESDDDDIPGQMSIEDLIGGADDDGGAADG